MTRTPQQHSADSRFAAYLMWSGVEDRAARLRKAHDNGPSGYSWHARRLFGQDVDVEALTATQIKQVVDARLSWLKAQSLKAVRAKRLKREAAREAGRDGAA
jgi:hypothetical protein